MVLAQGREAGAEPRAGACPEHGEHPPLAAGSRLSQASIKRLRPMDGTSRLSFGELERTKAARASTGRISRLKYRPEADSFQASPQGAASC